MPNMQKVAEAVAAVWQALGDVTYQRALVDGSSVDLTISAGSDGPVIKRIVIEAPAGGSITRDELAMLLEHAHDTATAAVVDVITTSLAGGNPEGPKVEEGSLRRALGDDADVTDRQLKRHYTNVAARRRWTPARLKELADVYQACDTGKPRDAVAQHFGISPSTASHYIRASRDADPGDWWAK